MTVRRDSALVLLPCLAVAVAVMLAALPAAGQLSPRLAKYVDALPIPPVAMPVGNYNDGVHGTWPLYDISINQFQQAMHRDLPLTTVQGYGSWTPGPIVIARRNRPLYMRFTNNLPPTPLVKLDATIPVQPKPAPAVRTAVHLHGGKVPVDMDGGPMDWFPVGASRVYWYPNDQQANLIWFHDHAMGITRTNVYLGMAGAYILRDNWEDSLNLPGPPGVCEIPLVIQDRIWDNAGQLVYTGSINPPWTFEPEELGDTIMVNGKVWPYMNVEPRKYRFRIINGSNARFYNMWLERNGPVLNQIGTDGGLLPATVPMAKLLIAPGERADVIVDFAGYGGRNFVLSNDAPAPYPAGAPPMGGLMRIMKFIVGTTLSAPDTSSLPANPRPVSRLNPAVADVVRDITLDEGLDRYGRLISKINRTPFMMPATEIVNEGDTEIWRFINTTFDTHPMHIHLVNFQILDRRPYDLATFLATGTIVYTGPAVPPDPNETAWKDTARFNSAEVTRVIMNFPKTASHVYTGSYVYHCHILEHEEHDMMRPLVVNPTP